MTLRIEGGGFSRPSRLSVPGAVGLISDRPNIRKVYRLCVNGCSGSFFHIKECVAQSRNGNIGHDKEID